MAVLNSTILEKVWLNGSNDYMQRVPSPQQQSYHDHVSAIFDPYNGDLFNVFTGLLNGIIGTYVEGKTFSNPLRAIKKDLDVTATYGFTERHIAVQYLQSRSYRADSETLLKYEPPKFSEWYYSATEPRMYDFSWSRFDLQRAFAQDGSGFSDLLDATISQAISSDEYDEMMIMLQMFAEAENSLDGGLFKHQISAFPNTEALGRELLAAIRAHAGYMKFPTTRYNHLPIPVHETGETLVLFVCPDVMAYLDVMALATVFQLDRANIQYRVIEVPEFPLPDVAAALCSEDFIWCRDAYYNLEPPFYNVDNLSYKYVLAHSEFLGVNPAANCCLFTYGS